MVTKDREQYIIYTGLMIKQHSKAPPSTLAKKSKHTNVGVFNHATVFNCF